MRNISIVICSLILFTLISCTDNKTNHINLMEGTWYYASTGPETTIHQLNNRQFTHLNTTNPIKELNRIYLKHPDKEGIIWLKTQFHVPPTLHNKLLSFLSSSMCIADETYCNGNLIGNTGRFPPNWFSEWNRPRHYTIPAGILIPDDANDLYIKLYVNNEGSLGTTLLIGNKNEVIKVYRMILFFKILLNLTVSAVLLYMAFYYLIIFLKRKKDKENLWFTILCLSFSIYLTKFFITTIPGMNLNSLSYLSFRKIINIVAYISIFCGIQFIFARLKITKTLFYHALMSPFYFCLLLLLIQTKYKYFTMLSIYTDLLFILPITIMLILIIRSVIKKNKQGILMLHALIPITICYLLDTIFHNIAGYIFNINYFIDVHLIVFGFPAMLFFISMITAKQFTANRNMIEELNTGLQNRITKQTRALHVAEDQLRIEKNISKKIQTMLLPDEPLLRNYEVSAYMMPAEDVGGDYYDFIQTNDADWFIIGDASGRGYTAGMIATIIKTAIHTILSSSPKITPAGLLSAVNKATTPYIKLLKGQRYMTITAICADKENNIVFSGMHQDILIYRAESKSIERIETEGIWLGILDDISHTLKDEKIILNNDDIILLFTDGIIEAPRNTNTEELYSIYKLIEVFQKSGDMPTNQIKNNILNNLKKYTCEDDVTLVIIKRKD